MRRPSYALPVAALILMVTLYSFTSAYALAGVPDSESGVFVVMARVVGFDVPGVSVRSSSLLWLARLFGLGMLASGVAIGVTQRRLARTRGRA